MNSLLRNWLALRASYQRTQGEVVILTLETAKSSNEFTSLNAIEMELSADKVVMYGGEGERGGFSADVSAADLAGAGIVTVEKFARAISHAFNSAPLFATGSYSNGTDGSLAFTAQVYGDVGNEINITAVNPGINGVLAVVTHGMEVSVTLATNGAGASTTTAAALAAALSGNAAAALLFSTLASGAGTGIVPAFSAIQLSGASGKSMYVLDTKQVNNSVITIHCGHPNILR